MVDWLVCCVLLVIEHIPAGHDCDFIQFCRFNLCRFSWFLSAFHHFAHHFFIFQSIVGLFDQVRGQHGITHRAPLRVDLVVARKPLHKALVVKNVLTDCNSANPFLVMKYFHADNTLSRFEFVDPVVSLHKTDKPNELFVLFDPLLVNQLPLLERNSALFLPSHTSLLNFILLVHLVIAAATAAVLLATLAAEGAGHHD